MGELSGFTRDMFFMKVAVVYDHKHVRLRKENKESTGSACKQDHARAALNLRGMECTAVILLTIDGENAPKACT
jgi:hypothetical protein